MKALILSNKKSGHPEELANDMARFSRMIEGLQHGGIQVQHTFVETEDELKDRIEQIKPNLVFSAAYAVKDLHGNQQVIHGLLDQDHIAYVGSDESTLALALDKAALKARWRYFNILTPDYFVVRKGLDGIVHGMDEAVLANDFPYILKPSKEGISHGITQQSIVSNVHVLLERLLELLSIYNEILVEKYLGEDEHLREFTVAMIGNHRQKMILPCEIVLTSNKGGNRAITTADKDGNGTQAFALEDQKLREDLIKLAIRAFSAAGVSDYARFEVLYSRGQFYAIEIDGQPMVPDRWFEACARGDGLDTDQYLNAIFLASIVRNMKTGHFGLQIPGKMAEILPGDIFRQIILA